ncbi:MAG: S53 family peptidase [Acidimicrobiales bacterium]
MTRLVNKLVRSIVVLALLATVLAVSVDRTATPASAVQVVDFGAVGPAAVAVWAGGALTPTTMVPLSTPLAMVFGFRSDHVGLEQRALAVSDPVSPDYGAYESVAQNGATFNGSSSHITQLTNWLDARSVTLTVDPTRSYATANVPISVLQQMTGATFGTYAVAGAPPDFVAITPTTEVNSLADSLGDAVDRVGGVTLLWDTSDNQQFVPAAIPEAAASAVQPSSLPVQPAAGGTPWRTGTAGAMCAEAEALDLGNPAYRVGLSPSQLRTAYGIDHLWDAGFRGKGARISIVDFSTYLPADIEAWRQCFGLSGTAVTDHLIGAPVFDSATSDETTLDIQTVLSIAPEADRIDWFGVQPTLPTLIGKYLQLFSAPMDASMTGGIATDVITASFGNCETEAFEGDPAYVLMTSLFDQVIATGVASGIGSFVSSGDTGSTGCYPNGPGTPNYAIEAQFPASSRWITAVGGTNLTLSADNHVVSSGAWNDRNYFIASLPKDGVIGSGGGGLSTFFLRQPWQPRMGSGRFRPVPDIAAFADELPGYFLAYQGTWMTVGGTSASTPLTAAAFALQSSAQAARDRPRLGFIAPLVHGLANGTPEQRSAIVDVVLGNNDAHLVGVYPAVDGYDFASGLGWVDHGVLYDILNSPVVDPPVIVPIFTG